MKGRPVTYTELGSLIQKEIDYSDNRQGSETQANSEDAYDYLLYRPKGDEVEGRNVVQAGDVADSIDNVQAEIQPMIRVDELVHIKAEGANDVEQSRVETEAINWYFRERARGFEKLDDAIQDALLLRNAYLKVWPEDSYKLPYEETLEGIAEQVEAEIMALSEQGEVRILEEAVVQEAEISTLMMLGEDGVSPIAVDVQTSPEIVSAKVLVIPRGREVLIEAVAREDMFVSRDATNQNMQKPRLVAQRRSMSRNYAVSLGFDMDQIWRIEPVDYVNQQTKTARMSDVQRTQTKAAHDGGDTILIYEVYYLIDMDGDGIAERHKIFYSNREVLKWQETGEEADEIVRVVPFASGVPLKVAHRHSGRSLFDKERAIEDSKRTLLRQGLDNIELANNRRPLLGPGVNPDDVEETEIGAYIRCSQGIAEYGEAGFTSVFNETLAGLSYLDKMRRERGAGAIDTANPQALPGNTSAHTTERTMSAAEQLATMMATNLAETLIRDTFVLLHQQLKILGESFSFEIGDEEWRTVEPRFWMDRERFSVNLGLSYGERIRRIAAYEGHYQKQLQLEQAGKGGELVDNTNIYNVLTSQANVQGLDDIQNIYTSPESPQAMQARRDKQEAQKQQTLIQQQMNQLYVNAELQRTRMQEETKRLSDLMEKQSSDMDRLNKYIIEMTKIEADTGQDIEGGVLIEDKRMMNR